MRATDQKESVNSIGILCMAVLAAAGPARRAQTRTAWLTSGRPLSPLRKRSRRPRNCSRSSQRAKTSWKLSASKSPRSGTAWRVPKCLAKTRELAWSGRGQHLTTQYDRKSTDLNEDLQAEQNDVVERIGTQIDGRAAALFQRKRLCGVV
jgi:hypothetical protein